MHLHKTFPLLIILPFSLLSEAAQNLNVLSSELDNLCQDNTQQAACNKFKTFELTQVESDEDSGYIICHQDSSKLSGRERKAEIFNIARNKRTGLKLSDETIYNRDGAYCTYGYMASTAAALLNETSDGKITAEPLHFMAKIRTGAFHNDDVGDSSSAHLPKVTVHVELCPGIVDSDTSAARLASSLVEKTKGDLKTEVNYFDTLEAKSDTHQRFEALLEDAYNTDFDCMNLINEAAIKAKFISSVHLTQISYELANTGEESKICHDFLIISLATQKEICSVEKKVRMKAMNDNAQWILQSGTGESRRFQKPFFDKGITGAGQVVAVSKHCWCT